MEYLISDEKIAKMRNYRSQRVLDYIQEKGFDFLFVWDYGNTRYAFRYLPRVSTTNLPTLFMAT